MQFFCNFRHSKVLFHAVVKWLKVLRRKFSETMLMHPGVEHAVWNAETHSTRKG